MSTFTVHKKKIVVIAIVVALFLIWELMMSMDYSGGREPVWGVSFSPSQAEYLGLDWKEVYRATLDDLNVGAVRLSAFWNEIEATPETYDFSRLDWMVSEASKRNKRIILAVGRRLPRWPECHDPSWLPELEKLNDDPSLSGDLVEDHLNQLTIAVVERYKNNPSIAMWQVENEYFLNTFGECPKRSKETLESEIALVRDLDSRPILVTDSGELSSWRKVAPLGDYLGTTMYRIVWNPVTGYLNYKYILSPFFYRAKAWLVGKPVNRMIGAELQAEPWAPSGLLAMQEGEYKKTMSADQLRANIDFARRTGFKEQYLWGVEYWYYLKQNGDSALWDAAKGLWK